MHLISASVGLLLLITALSTNRALLAQEAVEQSAFLSRWTEALESVSHRVAPSVVRIFVSRHLLPLIVGGSSNSLTREHSSGSGVIVSEDGYVVTNAHVVQNARRIQLLLAATRDETGPRKSILKPSGRLIPARIVGIDRETDLAVLKIEEEKLPLLEFGDSDELRQGQIVLAFGSPLGLENSVSLGVVSSVARQLQAEDPMIYIQTDAPINPGNSGGPLVDIAGRIIGINTLIFSQSGGNEGIGFAAPSNIVKHVYEEIREVGRVRRGHLGIKVQTITPILSAGLNLTRNWGVVVADVPPGGPASLGGLKTGDLILTLDGKGMENARQLEVTVYSRRPGDLVTLEVLRDSTSLEIQTPVMERPNDLERFIEMSNSEQSLVPQIGIRGVDVTAQLASLLPSPRKLGGVLVTALSSNTASWDSGPLPG
ncbi:MAG: trypsin-like peptidase domain-containing protein [Acidobacteriota bacterium]